ncbi:Conserved_hypothetical protein [Hexamita inflata]|uniref:RING-type domain-containing protein n=1 Tax=Hexamita inflata TaxID=28002 RepID=A0AA86NK43_9EUKA|nr:Conserved hypothetical protein [Hexamita inflata]
MNLGRIQLSSVVAQQQCQIDFVHKSGENTYLFAQIQDQLRIIRQHQQCELLDFQVKFEHVLAVSVSTCSTFIAFSTQSGLHVICTQSKKPSALFYPCKYQISALHFQLPFIPSFSGELLFGTTDGSVFATQFQFTKKLTLIGNQNQFKLLQKYNHPVLGIDTCEFTFDQILQNVAFFCGSSPSSFETDLNQKPINFKQPNQMNYEKGTMKRLFVLIGTSTGCKLMNGRGYNCSDVLSSISDTEYTNVIPKGIQCQVQKNVQFVREGENVVGWAWIAAQQGKKKTIQYNQIVFENEQDKKDGWAVIEVKKDIGNQTAQQIFTSYKNNQCITHHCFLGKFPQNIKNLFNGCCGIMQGAKPQMISSQSFLNGDEQFTKTFEMISLHATSFTSPLLVRPDFVRGFQITESQIILYFAQDVFIISQVSKIIEDQFAFSQFYDKQAEINNCLSVEGDKEIVSCCDNIIYGNNFITQSQLSDSDSWMDLVRKQRFQQALEIAGKYKNQVKYYQALEISDKTEAAKLFGKSSGQFSNIFIKLQGNKEAIFNYCKSKLEFSTELDTEQKNIIVSAAITNIFQYIKELQVQAEEEQDQNRKESKQEKIKRIQQMSLEFISDNYQNINFDIQDIIDDKKLILHCVQNQSLFKQFELYKTFITITKDPQIQFELFDLLQLNLQKNNQQILFYNIAYLSEIDWRATRALIMSYCKNNVINQSYLSYGLHQLKPQHRYNLLKDMPSLNYRNLQFNDAVKLNLLSEISQYFDLPNQLQIAQTLCQNKLNDHLTDFYIHINRPERGILYSPQRASQILKMVAFPYNILYEQLFKKYLFNQTNSSPISYYKILQDNFVPTNIETILTDSVQIDFELKQLIKDRIQSLQSELEILKNNVENANRAASGIDQNIFNLQRRFFKIGESKCSICKEIIHKDKIAFVCSHNFHLECIAKCQTKRKDQIDLLLLKLDQQNDKERQGSIQKLSEFVNKKCPECGFDSNQHNYLDFL